MSSLPKPDAVKAPPGDRNRDLAPIHPARELDRVFLDHYVAGNLPFKSRRAAVLQIFLLWGIIGSAAALSLDPPVSTAAPLSSYKNDLEHQGITFQLKTTSGPLTFGLIVVGLIEH